MKDYSELKKFAEYATPGPWVAQHPNAGQRGSEVASSGGLNQVCADLGPSNALYIAASNPTAVLELITEVEALRKLVIELRGSVNCHNVHHCKSEQHDFSEPCKVLSRIDLCILWWGIK